MGDKKYDNNDHRKNEEIKAYEDDLKARNMPPTNVDIDGNVLDVADPYGLKPYYELAEKQASGESESNN